MVMCHSCGAEIPSDASFCPRCGSRTDESFDKRYREMKRELGRAKHGNRRGRVWSPKLGLINLILAGLLVIYATAIIYLASAGVTGVVTRDNAWAYLLVGLGAYLFGRVIVRYLMKR